MSSEPLRSRLLAILAADAAGYSRSMSRDERSAVAALDRGRAAFREAITAHGGRVVDMAGDSVLSVFDTALGAVQAALSVQQRLAGGANSDGALRFRIGVHVGDVLEKPDGTVYGDGVNIAARIEGLAAPGAVAVSATVHALVARRIEFPFDDIGEQSVKNIAEPVRVYRVRLPWAADVPLQTPAGAAVPRPLSFDGGRVQIDLGSRQLAIAGTAAKLGGRAFDLLLALVERRERVVPKQELLDVVWPGLIVEENNLHVHVAALRRLLGPQALATVSGRGYRFTLAADRPVHATAERPAAAPAAASVPPPGRDTLLGRDALLAETTAALQRGDVRLLTLTGPGGSGKTRVAMRVSAEMSARLADGSYIVLLAPVRQTDHLMAAVAQALGIKESGSESLLQLVQAYLRPREVLLTLDNFEHLPEAAAQVAALLAECPRLKVLVSSRVLLHLNGEHELKVPPLALPANEDPASAMASPAVALFASRAALLGRDVAATPQDLAAAVRICKRLDGLPLAIELAAARLRALTPAALADRLNKSLPLLKAAGADAPERQQTLRATIAWSYELLEAPVRALFCRLGVFAGGWSLEAAEAIGDDLEALDALETLIEHNLVQRVDDVDGQPRYAMLETIREYALEQLEAQGLVSAVRDRHARYFAQTAAQGESRLTSPARLPELVRLRAEISNLRQALDWLMHGQRDVPAAMAMAASLTWLWYFDGLFGEGRARLREAEALPGAERFERECAAVWSGQARLAGFGGDMAEAHRLGERAIAAWRKLGDRRGLAFALFNHGVPSSFITGKEAAVAVLQESCALFRELGDVWGVAIASTYEGVVLAFTPGTEEAALATLNEALARCTAIGDEWAATTNYSYIGAVAMRRGDFKSARRNFMRGLDNARETNDRFRIARGSYLVGQLDLVDGQPQQAALRLGESMLLGFEQGRTNETPQMLRSIARALVALGQHADAVLLFGAGSREPPIRPTLPPEPPNAVASATAACRAALGDDRFEQGWHDGAMLTTEQAVRRAAAFVEQIKGSMN